LLISLTTISSSLSWDGCPSGDGEGDQKYTLTTDGESGGAACEGRRTRMNGHGSLPPFRLEGKVFSGFAVRCITRYTPRWRIATMREGEGPVKEATRFRLIPESRKLLERLASHLGLSQAGTLEMWIRERARREKVTLPKEVGQ
jgi:hypothetical protein